MQLKCDCSNFSAHMQHILTRCDHKPCTKTDRDGVADKVAFVCGHMFDSECMLGATSTRTSRSDAQEMKCSICTDDEVKDKVDLKAQDLSALRKALANVTNHAELEEALNGADLNDVDGAVKDHIKTALKDLEVEDKKEKVSGDEPVSPGRSIIKWGALGLVLALLAVSYFGPGVLNALKNALPSEGTPPEIGPQLPPNSN